MLRKPSTIETFGSHEDNRTTVVSMLVMAHTTRRVTYRGNPAFASMLVQMLEQEGATVEWERPLEQRGMAEMAQEVIVNMVAAGNLVAIKAVGLRRRTCLWRQVGIPCKPTSPILEPE